MRIALVTPGFAPEVGGIESYVESLSVELNALGYAVDVLTKCPHGRAAEWSASVVNPGIRVLRFGDWTGTRRFRIAPGLWRDLRHNGRRTTSFTSQLSRDPSVCGGSGSG
jgi:glycosyltransferase involved in cell wall biosynthesis